MPAQPLFWFTLECYPLVSQEYCRNYITLYEFFIELLSITNSNIPGFWVVGHSRTLISESILHSVSITLSKFSLLTSLIILQVIPSLIDYIIIMLNFNCAIWAFFPEYNFWRWANITLIFLVISFLLEQQAWFRVCVVRMVPVTFRFIIPLNGCHRWSITSPWNLSTNVLWSSSTFWLLAGYQPNSWW